MKILLVTEYFYPQSSGGTELYVYNLATILQEYEHEVNVLSVFDGDKKSDTYRGINIAYIPFNRDFRTEVINGDKPADNIESFTNAICKIKPDVIHFHTLTTSIGADHIIAAKQAGFKTVLTSHIASHTCIRGTLMQMGKFVCDGKVEEQKCLSCYLQLRNIPEPFCNPTAMLMRFINFPNNTAQIVKHKQNELQKLRNAIDQLVVVSNWQRDVFIKNGFDPQKLNLCRQAVEICKTSLTTKKNPNKLVIGFIGRATAVKGLHVLLSSLKYVPTDQLELKIAVIPTLTELDYYRQQKQHVESLPHANWIENLPNENINSFLQELDILCVPSQVLETGPFVVYEALAQGVPVLGSNLGGIAELISEGKNGWLFPRQDEKYLGLLIASFITQKLEGKLLNHIEPINRSVNKLAEEMVEIYNSL